jgi:chromate transporter
VVFVFVRVPKIISMSDKFSSRITQDDESYLSLFWIFLKIGSTAFGGFMALIAVVENYLVERKKLLTHEDMLNGVSLATILPGPIAVNVVAYSGYKIRGLFGAFVCVTAVILPSFLLILALSHAYFTWGEIPSVSKVFNGFLPAVAAIIISAAFNMGKKTLNSYIEISIAVISMLVLIFIGGLSSTLAILIISGVIGYVVFIHEDTGPSNSISIDSLIPKNLIATISAYSVVFGLAVVKANAIIFAKLFSIFSSMSVLLFGGGFVFIPLIQEIVVGVNGWLSNKEFIDGIALGQVTPGPILISATFIGYKVAGFFGALVATIGIFMPPAILMLVCTNFLDALNNSGSIKSILKGIRCAVIGLISAAAYVVISSAEMNVTTLIIFVVSLVMLFLLKLEVVWVILATGIAGFLMY